MEVNVKEFQRLSELAVEYHKIQVELACFSIDALKMQEWIRIKRDSPSGMFYPFIRSQGQHIELSEKALEIELEARNIIYKLQLHTSMVPNIFR
ncbi:MAG: hypothetical protein HC877_18950 [Thioploca sp.]|nr:hypothetical protein [Thioploca sp.]